MKVAPPKNLHTQINKAQSSLVVVVAVATVVTVFCLVSTKALLSQGSYQRHVINERHKAVNQLKSNLSAANQLVSQFNSVFENSGPVNALGGKNDSSPGAVPPDGDNARLVLDALPSSYDFPALVSSLTKILTADGIQNPSIGGTDGSATASNQATTSPQPISIDVPISGSTSYAGLQKLLSDLQRSTRPFDITSMQISGNNTTMTFNMQMNTYYQPPKSLDVTSKVISK